MANPQKENGFTAIANEIMEHLCKLSLTDYESRILHVLFRKTYGWDKKADIISLGQFSEMTSIRTQHVARTVKQLVGRNIITVQYITPQSVQYAFQKNYELWDKKDPLDIILEAQLLPNEVVPSQVVPNEVVPSQVVPNEDTGSTCSGRYNNNITTTNNNKRNNILLCNESVMLTQKLIDLMVINDPNAKIPENLENWQSEIDKLIRIDKRNPEDISKVIEWCQNDTFWKTNILSASKLRKQFSQLFLKMRNSNGNGHNGNGNNGNGNGHKHVVGEDDEAAIAKFVWADQGN